MGDPRSPHFDDLIDDWREGKYHPMPYTRAAVEAATTRSVFACSRANRAARPI